MRKKITISMIVLGMLSTLAQADDMNRPNASNFRKHNWAVHVQGSESTPGVFVLLSQKNCKNKYKGKLKGIETKVALWQATVHSEDEGRPGNVIGKGCWSATVEEQQFEYLGYQGEFNSDKGSGVIEIPWSEIFDLDKAG